MVGGVFAALVKLKRYFDAVLEENSLDATIVIAVVSSRQNDDIAKHLHFYHHFNLCTMICIRSSKPNDFIDERRGLTLFDLGVLLRRGVLVISFEPPHYSR